MSKKKALLEAEEIIKWVARWVGKYKSKEAKEWLEKHGTKKDPTIIK